MHSTYVNKLFIDASMRVCWLVRNLMDVETDIMVSDQSTGNQLCRRGQEIWKILVVSADARKTYYFWVDNGKRWHFGAGFEFSGVDILR